ncbi:MAG: MFS transporter [Corynebacterium humireducens]|jgi:UMF1 family MFS transporter|uniref:MFS transporter n=1 Tax=Corynebacterium humireducens TaxID=1223514 RepID=A0A7X6PQ07_9CORY|nr:MFS transporter [Corynebacterium humireducens]
MNTLRTDRATVTAWALWDWGSAAFNAVLVTFIFSVYLTDSVGTTLDSRYTPTTLYGLVMAVAGVLIAVVAPIVGQRADLKGTRRRSLGVWTFITIALMFSLFTVRNDAPVYFWVGAVIMAVASVLFEFAEVNYYAQLKQISTPENVGRVSGFGWGMGYAGGIVLLLICYFGFVAGEGGMFGLPTEGGLNIRLVAVFAAVWFAVFAIPVLVRVPEIRPSGAADTEGVLDAYRRLLHTIRDLWRADRNALYFLFSSAVFRDGLAGVFTFGAILAVTVYGLTPGDVLLFGVAANVAAAAGAMLGGFLDDILGPKPIIIASLVLMIASAGVLYFVEGPQMFWIFGLILCLFVGPAQSAARSFLSRVAPDGREGQLFGLYVTTGRAVSWLSPLAFGLFVLLGGADRFGILGIGLILLVGALLLIPVVDPTRRAR